MIRCVDFSEYTDNNGDNELHDALETSVTDRDSEKTFVFFDDDHKTVWLCWYWDKELQREKD